MRVEKTSDFTRTFKKYLALLNARQLLLVEERMRDFSQNPFLPQFRTHKLTTGEWSATILKDAERNDRIIFERKKYQVILLTIGSHDEVY